MVRIIAFGSRHWDDEDAVRAVLIELRDGPLLNQSDIVLIHGAARGADSIAGGVAKRFGWAVEEHPADWDRFGKSAGHRRNKHMAELGAWRAVGFPRGVTPGTFNMIEHCVRCGIYTVLHPGKPVNDVQKERPTR